MDKANRQQAVCLESKRNAHEDKARDRNEEKEELELTSTIFDTLEQE